MGIITQQHSFDSFIGKGVKKNTQQMKRKFQEFSSGSTTTSMTTNLSSPVRSQLKKRNHTHNEIFGEKLSIPRILETLEKSKLEDLINRMISERPELVEIVENESPKITIDNALIELNKKLDLILNNLPYKVDIKSDYAFLRVKNQVNEFFQALSDYSLNFLPPVLQDYKTSIRFLVQFLIEMFHRLPKFGAIEFNYYYNLTIEKFNTILFNSIKNFLSERKQNLLVVKDENWIEEFRVINELNNNNFERIQIYLENEIENYYNSGSIILNEDSNINSSNKLSGLDNLLNFAFQNNSTIDNI